MKEYSFEAAWDNTQSVYNGDDDLIRSEMAHVFMKIPEEVRDYVLEECYFFSAGKEYYGVVWPSYILSENRNPVKWIILLSEGIPKRQLESVIAHEIAHAYLKHDRLTGEGFQCEFDACELVKRWGFKGIGARVYEDNYSHFEGMFYNPLNDPAGISGQNKK